METSGDDGSGPAPGPGPVGAPDPGTTPSPASSAPTASAPSPTTSPTADPRDTRPPIGLAAGEWPAQAADTIVELVGTVRDKTTGPITKVARGAVFGLFLAVVATIVIVMALIGVVRLMDEALPSGVWLPYLILGVLFVAGGALVYRRRRPVPV